VTNQIIFDTNYTLKNGEIWFCYYATGCTAYMVQSAGDKAHEWDRDGTALSLEGVYDVDWAAHKESVNNECMV
jgi:hypothetical protein